MVYINLPVADVDASASFFSSLGFTLNPRFSDETTRCVVIEDNIITMLHAPEKWAQFLQGEAAPRGATEVMIALSAADRAECDDLRAKALANGGAEYAPTTDLGFMYGTSFRDPDGHCWEVTWMDPATIEG
ncbi:glyoxalase [Kineococcus sp. R8]|uniref:VOC family protein n=1 Tax=Kineococcus siccus TaxID=2696567 RepID=UPI001413594D|nr:VOC family protein [Kineococcus siccus]NAZ83270.1 glyoxalase [Kineococcus siccus]